MFSSAMACCSIRGPLRYVFLPSVYFCAIFWRRIEIISEKNCQLLVLQNPRLSDAGNQFMQVIIIAIQSLVQQAQNSNAPQTYARMSIPSIQLQPV